MRSVLLFITIASIGAIHPATAMAAWTERKIDVAVAMSNTSWAIKLREIYVSSDTLNVIAELIPPKSKMVGRAVVWVRDSLTTRAPPYPIRYHIVSKVDWAEGQIKQLPANARFVRSNDPILGRIRKGKKIYPIQGGAITQPLEAY